MMLPSKVVTAMFSRIRRRAAYLCINRENKPATYKLAHLTPSRAVRGCDTL